MERKYKKTKLTIDKEIRDNQSEKVVQLIQEKKIRFYQNKLIEADHKETFKLINSLSTPPNEQPLPCDRDATGAAAAFCEFFTDKIKKIKHALGNESAGNDALALDS